MARPPQEGRRLWGAPSPGYGRSEGLTYISHTPPLPTFVGIPQALPSESPDTAPNKPPTRHLTAGSQHSSREDL